MSGFRIEKIGVAPILLSAFGLQSATSQPRAVRAPDFHWNTMKNHAFYLAESMVILLQID
jgi:hypothetical protein